MYKRQATLVLTSVGFDAKEVVVSAADGNNFTLTPSNALGQEVVVSATKMAQRIMESPVSIERVSTAAIRNAPAASYYDVVSNLKGVDVVTSSLTFKTPTTRGFGGSGNVRFNQIVDGMDNQAPGLNFSVGSVVGLTQLDVESMELLPGASSALYGPGGMNGTLIINSKNPFRHQGLSFEIKTGMMHVDKRQRDISPYHNWAMRYAHKFSEKFAFKITSEFINAKDWVADDYRNYSRTGNDGAIIGGNRLNSPAYDGVSTHGDEPPMGNINDVLNAVAAQAPFLAPYIATLTTQPTIVSRTGYREVDIVNPNTTNFKLGGSLNYKFTPNTEAILGGYWGMGNTVYTGAGRYSLQDLKMGQYKLELNNKNWMLRGYTTQEDAGNSYNIGVTTRLATERWKPSAGSTGWYAQYGQAFLQSKLAGMTDADAHAAARAVADQGRPEANSAEWKQLFNAVSKIPISQGGGRFVDKTNLYMIEGQYNLSQWTSSVAEILVGGNWKRYALNSEGTLFADKPDSGINIDEWGGYVQATRAFLDDKLKFTFSGRYDKNQNFEGKFTPRATALVKVGTGNVRLSYQTAYRFPSTQQQWIELSVGGSTLLGGQPYFWDKYNLVNNPVYYLSDMKNGVVTPFRLENYKPESVTSYEIGYKGLHLAEKILIDLYGYYGQYQDFITRTDIVQDKDGGAVDLTLPNSYDVYSVPVNIKDKVTTYGYGLSLDYRFYKSFGISFNGSSDVLKDVPDGFVSFFNSPKYRTNVSLYNNGFGPNSRLGFNVSYRWQDTFYYNSDFANGTVPAINVVDAQISAKFPKTKSILKLGANNLLNQYYVNGIGNARVGGLYYLSIGYNLY